jgi:hypothetical protein
MPLSHSRPVFGNAHRARRPLMAFVMVLSYSRHIFLRFFLNAGLEELPAERKRGLILDFTAAALGRLVAVVAGDDWSQFNISVRLASARVSTLSG